MEECQTGSKVDYQSASYGVSFGRDVPPKYFYINVINNGDVEYIDPEKMKIKISPIECMSGKSRKTFRNNKTRINVILISLNCTLSFE